MARDLLKTLAKAKLKGPKPPVERVRKMLAAFLEAVPGGTGAQAMNDGRAAVQLGHVDLRQMPPPEGLACAAGCAFCCILSGEDGGTITETEARGIHAALAPLAGRPDGRDWHPRACPSLDPETRQCRAYDVRPMICRSYVSRDVTACEKIANEEVAEGAGVLGAYTTYLTAQALARVTLGPGLARTYGLRDVARAAVDGVDVGAALEAARHKPKELEAERMRVTPGK
jgi:Fe-S-cluster containining protein